MTKQPKLQDAWSPGTEVVSMYHFESNEAEYLSFKKGEVMTIVKTTKEPIWCVGRNQNGRQGMIPTNYVQKRGEVKLHAMPWFHGKMSKMETEQKLAPIKRGLFLICESNNFLGDYSLSVCDNDKIDHYHIVYHGNKLTIDEEVFFENLTQLVEHYEMDADGLCTRLIQPVEKQGKLEYPVDQKTFEEQGLVIQPKDIKLGDFIGGGDFANVYKAVYVSNNTPVAAKTLKDENRATQHLLVEAALMTSLQHPNLVKLIGVVTGGPNIQIITEYMAKGNLLEYLRSRDQTIITNEDQIKFASDTCRGMAYLESKNLVHRKLAARNMLLNEEGVAKVSDFALTKPVDANMDDDRLPIKWTAPEALRECIFTNKSDMWSFGILLWEIYSFGREPYPGIPLEDVVSYINDGNQNERPDGCPEEIYKIMQQTWNLDAKLRPTFNCLRFMLELMRAPAI